MFVILVIISTVAVTNALNPAANIELGDEKVKELISKYIAKIPDIEEQYIIDERLTKAISHYFKGKISTFPLYKVSVKIDRNPVKIPWSLGEPNANSLEYQSPTNEVKPRALKEKNKQVKKRYKYAKVVKQSKTSEKPIEKLELTTPEIPVMTKASSINTTL